MEKEEILCCSKIWKKKPIKIVILNPGQSINDSVFSSWVTADKYTLFFSFLSFIIPPFLKKSNPLKDCIKEWKSVMKDTFLLIPHQLLV